MSRAIVARLVDAVLAELLAEDVRPPAAIWSEPLISSRLLEYEVWTRINARRLAASHGDAARQAIAHISLVELSPVVLARALEPFAISLRTLDALHLATIEYLRAQNLKLTLATYDDKMRHAASRLAIELTF